MADSQEPGKLPRKAEEGNSFTIANMAESQEPGKQGLRYRRPGR